MLLIYLDTAFIVRWHKIVTKVVANCMLNDLRICDY